MRKMVLFIIKFRLTILMICRQLQSYAYYNSMRETFSEFEKVRLEDENGNPTSFESVGKSEEDLKKTFPYYRYYMPSG